MDPRLCHALQCTAPGVREGCFCEHHWKILPPTLRTRVAQELSRVQATTKRTSGSFASAVILAVRWLAVEERLMPGPHPPVS